MGKNIVLPSVDNGPETGLSEAHVWYYSLLLWNSTYEKFQITHENMVSSKYTPHLGLSSLVRRHYACEPLGLCSSLVIYCEAPITNCWPPQWNIFIWDTFIDYCWCHQSEELSSQHLGARRKLISRRYIRACELSCGTFLLLIGFGVPTMFPSHDALWDLGYGELSDPIAYLI